MRRIMIPALAVALAAAPAVLEAQTPRGERTAPGAQGMRGIALNPAARVLQQREALGLNAAQVSRLEQLQRQTEERNQPLVQQLQAARPNVTPAQRQQMRERMQQVTPEQREQLRQRMQEQRAELTPEQRQQMQARREQMRNATPEQRERLRAEMQAQLAPEQRAQMEERRAQMEQRRAEMQRQLTPERRARMEAVRPVMQQLRESNELARRDVQAVLTAEQQARLRELTVQRAGQGRDRLQERRGPGGQRAMPGARRGAAR
jgi:hypothetical protein